MTFIAWKERPSCGRREAPLSERAAGVFDRSTLVSPPSSRAPPDLIIQTDNHTVDNTLLPTSTWALAINPDTLTVQDTSNNTDSIPHYTWKPGNLPVSMTVQACPISWDVVNGTASAPPQSPNACTGDVFEARLLPFGSNQLRLGEMPLMQA